MHICVIPVKDFKDAKARLSGLLSPEERARLALAMYQDVLDVALRAAAWARVLVVSTNRTALDIAERRGALVHEEAVARGHSASVELAAEVALRMGGTALLSLPVDVPLIGAQDIGALWSRFQRLRRVHGDGAALALLAPARDALGTNALLRCPPDSLPCRFGFDSLRRHLREAAARGVICDVYENPRLALDIDTPDDLVAFLNYPRVALAHPTAGGPAAEDGGPCAGAGTRSYRELLAMNIWPRVS